MTQTHGARRPLIADIKQNSLDDGPGIRTVIFFKGCPLRCLWCQNPETMSTQVELQRSPARCTSCGSCQTACPSGVARPGAEPQAKRCQLCGACVEVCGPAGRRLVGERLSVEALVERVSRDAPFFKRSGGGVTFSGGEPTLHPRYLGRAAALLGTLGIHRLLETCGLFSWSKVREKVLPHIDTIYFDFKIADADRHRTHAGQGNARILDNLSKLAKSTARAPEALDLLVRVPLVPGITDDDENLAAIAAQVAELGLERLALLPYNPTWIGKRQGLAAGADALPYAHAAFMAEAELSRCCDTVRAAGLEVVD